jgi:pyrimidine deaminase RibD-like protein
MKFLEFTDSDYRIHDRKHLDQILLELCQAVMQGQQEDPIKYGMVAACVLDPDHQTVISVNEAYKNNTRKHAERVAIESYKSKYGKIPEGSIIITTLSPCNEDGTEMAAGRYGESCTDLINSSMVRKVYCGYIDPTQENEHNKYTLEETSNKDLKQFCKKISDTFLSKDDVDENFADGKGPGRPGDSQRHGIPKGASMSELEKASHSKGRKGQLARWQLNMRRGHKNES